ncbi:MAG TPA: hypothetical protein VK509_12880, partial [Polyangiales bacterium]|nr:hypothetical protein [Polyangiales bacterium]
MGGSTPPDPMTEVAEPGTLLGRVAAAPVQTSETAPRVLPERIGGRYLVKEELGRGGMAVVYRVVDPASGREL